MLSIRRSQERGLADHGWLRSFHTFSFADYHDAEHMGFGPLRVINEDRVQPGRGFGEHGHRDMEILSYVLDGELEHKDSMGNGSIIRPGDVQRMSAGTGVVHSEFNPSTTALVHFFQIWIQPSSNGIPPGYEERHFDAASKRGQLRLVASPDGSEGSVTIHQDARLFASLLDANDRVTHPLGAGRLAYMHVARGSVVVNGERLGTGDALKAAGVDAITLDGAKDAEILLFDLPQ